MNVEEVKEYLIDNGYDDTIVLEEPDYVTAIIGISQNGQLVYDYDKMVKHLCKKDNVSESSAVEFIDYNTLRAIPYMGEKAPIVVNKIF